MTSTPDAPRADWLGAQPGRRQVAAAFVVGVVGIVVAGLQPVLLGSLQAAGRISAVQLGHAATVELLALGLGAGAAGALLERLPRRLVTLLAGLVCGVMIWVLTGVIVRSPAPARWAGAYLAIQTLVQLLTAAALGLVAPGRPEGAPLAMAGLGLLAMLSSLALPDRLTPLPREATASGLPPARGWMVLAAAALLQACIVGTWVYLEPLGAQAHLAAAVVALATPLCLGAQVLGAFTATAVAGRLPWFAALMVAGLALTAATLGLSLPTGPLGFLALETLFGFAWLFILPFLTPLAIEVDPTRRTAVLGPAASLIGAALGPLAASMLVGDSDARSALHLCAAFALAGVGLIFGLHVRRRRPLSGA